MWNVLMKYVMCYKGPMLGLGPVLGHSEDRKITKQLDMRVITIVFVAV